MGIAGRLSLRNPTWIGLLTIIAAGLGIASAVQPKLGFEATLGLVFVAAVLGNVTVGLALYTVLSFLEVINVGGGALSLMKVAGLLLFVSWFATVATRTDQERRSVWGAQPSLVAAAVALVSWSAVSIVWAASPSTALTSTDRYLLNILIFPIVFAAIRRREQFVWIVAAFVAGAALSAAYSVVHPATAGRLTGTIGDPNEEAAVLVAALMFAAGLFTALPRGSRRRWWTVMAGLIILAGFLSTISRGGLVALGLTLLAGTVFGGRWRRHALLLTVIGAASVVLYLAAFASVSALQHVNNTNSTGRTDIWTVGWRMLQSHPLTGVGSGNFPTSAVHYVQQPGQITRADLIVAVPHATHNTYLQIADELGLPGLIAFLAVCAASLAGALKAARTYEQAGDVAFGVLSRVLFLAILGVLAADFFISGEDSKQLWLLLALPVPLLALAPSDSDR